MSLLSINGIRALAMLAVLTGCASPSPSTPVSRPETVYAGTTALKINPDNGATTKTLDAPLDRVWLRLPTAYDSVGIPLTLMDPRRHVMGNEGFKVRQTLAKRRLSGYFECGSTQVGPNADSYEVYLTILTTLEADGAQRTKMTTTVTAQAKPMQFAQDYSRCSSKSTLETRISDIVTAAVLK